MSSRQPRLYALDALRGVCAVALMFYHYFMWNGADYFQIGYFGVYMFFMLSGFSMWYVYAAKPLTTQMIKHFFIARVARIFPLYLLAVGFATVARYYAQGLSSITNSDFIHRAFLNITLLFGFEMPGRTSVVPGGWSIGIEWVFYLAFPLFLMFMPSLATMAVLLAAALALNQLIVGGLFTDSNLTEQWVAYTNFPTFIMYFIGGMMVAMVYNALPWNWRNVPAWTTRVMPLLCLGLMFLYPSDTAESYLQGWHVALLLASGMVGIFFASFARPVGWEMKLYHFLGDVSYSTYLINFFVYNVVMRVLNHLYPQYNIMLLATLSGAATLMLAYLSYRFYENPARRWINDRLIPYTSK